MREITAVGREIAVTEDGTLCEYLTDTEESGLSEAVWLGRVVRVMPSLSAAFVDIGQEKNGFLPFAESSKSFQQSPLRDGDRVLVQVKREARGEKGAYLTRDITFCGEYVIFMPFNRYIGVSSRVQAEAQRRSLRQLGERLSGGAFGLVLRSAALRAEEADIAAEISRLRASADAVRAAAPTAHAPSMVFRPRSLLEQLLDDYLPRGGCTLKTTDAAAAERLRGRCPVEVLPEDAQLPPEIAAQRDKARQRRVWLRSGGNLVIDCCEACTVIDVNTAKSTAGSSRTNQLGTNLEAAEEIARQLRLRNIGGIILIDMIDMEEERDRQRVLDALAEACAADRVKTVIHGFTHLGLVEMTRKRTARSLREGEEAKA